MIVNENSCLLMYKWYHKRSTKHHFATSQFLRFSKKWRFKIHVRHANRLSRFEITNDFDTNRQWDESYDRFSTIKKIQFCATNWDQRLFEREIFTSKIEIIAINVSKWETFHHKRQRNFFIQSLSISLLNSSQFRTTTWENSFDEDQRKIQEKTIDDRHSTTIEKIVDDKTKNVSNNRIRFREKNSCHWRVFHFCHIINEKWMSTTNNNN